MLRWHQPGGEGRGDAASSLLHGCGSQILLAGAETRHPRASRHRAGKGSIGMPIILRVRVRSPDLQLPALPCKGIGESQSETSCEGAGCMCLESRGR